MAHHIYDWPSEIEVQDRRIQPNHLYIQVRRELVQRIADGLYPAGSSIPNEFALAQEMQVSVGTVRKAIDALSADHLLVRRQGRGTLVANRQSADYRGKFDRIRHADGTAIAWKFREVDRETRKPTQEEQQKLRIAPDQSIVSLRRQREEQGQVVKSEYVRLPLDLFSCTDELDISETTIENLSILRGVPIVCSDERLSIIMLADEKATELGLPVKESIIRLDRLVYGGERRPIEWRIAHCYLGDREYHAASPCGQNESDA